MLMEKWNDMEIEYKFVNTFSIGMLISQFDYDLPYDEYYSRILNSLNNAEVPP